MARKKQTFDPHALTREVVSATHEVVTVPFRLRTYRVIRKILIIFIAVSIVNVVFANVFYTPKMYRILRENSELVFKYRLLQDKIRAEQRKLNEIHHRDNFVYRALFSADTLNIGGIYTPYPASKYAALAGDEYAPLMIGTWQQLDAFGRQLYRTSVSFDELQILAKNKENMSTAIPAIWPIDRPGPAPRHRAVRLPQPPDLPPTHPAQRHRPGGQHRQQRLCHGRRDGTVHRPGTAPQRLRQADPPEPPVRLPDPLRPPEPDLRQTRREGRARTTDRQGRQHGGVTGPHLHYEVIHMGQVVNPINYFNRNMTNEEYERLMEQMQELNLDTFDE